MNRGPEYKFACLLEWVCHLQQSGNLLELVDEKLGSEFNKVEAERMIKVAVLCTIGTPSSRPTMSEVVNMLEGTSIIPDVISEERSHSEDLRFKIMRDHLNTETSDSGQGSRSHNTKSVRSAQFSSSASTSDI
uniref:LRR-RLK n=1 Tax=Vernicia montana TaxID=316732 RepID=A0A140G4H7_9ROSI|nr:LRR-RLK [Vernicia montana]